MVTMQMVIVVRYGLLVPTGHLHLHIDAGVTVLSRLTLKSKSMQHSVEGGIELQHMMLALQHLHRREA